ncbi:group I intron-associated PD-(D/E)XK endonuclease [Propionivibrio sp.]|uniref:group I intron-associated PD-(D/E)XK endonuclease n=1 Tax=Propionivibrio sp. TaxID=2212460 RepID=UPI0039E3E90B
MPVRNASIKETTLAAHKQLSYENLLAAWLLGDGWEVLIPAIDHGKKTDLVVADDKNYYRIQVKSIQNNNESVIVHNKWQGAKIDYVVYFSTVGEWGYIAPAFAEESRPLNSPGHVRFHSHSVNFLKAFKKI